MVLVMAKKGQRKKEEHHQVKELKETLQRVQADFENSRKRMEKEKEEFMAQANSGIVKELLPLLDSVDSAEKNTEQAEAITKEEAKKGIELIKKQLLAILKAHGLKEMECTGKKFDPMQQEALMQGKDEEKEEGTVLEEFQKGYTLNGKVLRHAKVKVNKK